MTDESTVYALRPPLPQLTAPGSRKEGLVLPSPPRGPHTCFRIPIPIPNTKYQYRKGEGHRSPDINIKHVYRLAP